ncbi:MAG: hypothetical protein RL291_255 [Pseudomonadota bacterium]|jgi:hypothetical protein
MTPSASSQPFKIAVGILLIAFGIGTAAASVPQLSEPARLFVDLVFWPLDGKQSLASSEARLLAGILGGVLIGWGVTLVLVADRVAPSVAKPILATGIWSWFVVDSTASTLAGSPLNAIVNALILGALLWTLGKFGESREASQR